MNTNKNEAVKQRQLKISCKSFARAKNRYVTMPKILLTGKWLQDIGFTEGGFITVLYKKQKMVIQLKKYTNDEINFRNMKQEEEEKRLANAQRRKERRCNFG